RTHPRRRLFPEQVRPRARGHPARRVTDRFRTALARDAVAACRGDGRGVSRARHEARSGRGDQGPPREPARTTLGKMEHEAMRRALVGLLISILALVHSSCGGGCAYRLVARLSLVGAIPCCDGYSSQDVKVGEGQEYDIAYTDLGGQAGQSERWLAQTNCNKLFDQGYHGDHSVLPLCATLFGPLSPGSVSARRKLPSGTYRLFVQTWSSESPYRY